jgi:hypothetical protein
MDTAALIVRYYEISSSIIGHCFILEWYILSLAIATGIYPIQYLYYKTSHLVPFSHFNTFHCANFIIHIYLPIIFIVSITLIFLS